jgi:N-acetylneuraminate lyase
MDFRLTGLVAAPHSPFHSDGALNLDAVEKQAEHLVRNCITGAFICGTTGEYSSLTLDERRALAQRWVDVVHGASLKVIVHVGSNCLADAKMLAHQAEQLGAQAIGALAPSYFKPRDVTRLVDFMADLAAAAPSLPFYYYEIPTMTGLAVPPSEFLDKAADRIPNLAGLKFTSSNLMEYQLCRHLRSEAFDAVFGFDEMLLGALAMGAQGAVGSTYNFAAPVYHRLIAAFKQGDFATAREEQFRSVRLIQLLVGYGFTGAAKAAMKLLGVDVGPARLPLSSLTADETARLRRQLEELGFFEWIAQI